MWSSSRNGAWEPQGSHKRQENRREKQPQRGQNANGGHPFNAEHHPSENKVLSTGMVFIHHDPDRLGSTGIDAEIVAAVKHVRVSLSAVSMEVI